MSGLVRVDGHASQSAGASPTEVLLVIEGSASARCGISMKGVDIVVRGSVGHMSAFMGQTGNLVICGDAGEALGDSLYEARIFVRGQVAGLGADCIEKDMSDSDHSELKELLGRSGVDVSTDGLSSLRIRSEALPLRHRSRGPILRWKHELATRTARIRDFRPQCDSRDPTRGGHGHL